MTRGTGRVVVVDTPLILEREKSNLVFWINGGLQKSIDQMVYFVEPGMRIL